MINILTDNIYIFDKYIILKMEEFRISFNKVCDQIVNAPYSRRAFDDDYQTMLFRPEDRCVQLQILCCQKCGNYCYNDRSISIVECKCD